MEKRVESLLNKHLESFNQAHIYYTPNENEELKRLFKRASKKSENGRGIPDRIYYDGQILIIFECKPNDLTGAKNDLLTYKNKMLKTGASVYFVAYTETTYEIYDYDLNILNGKLIPETFKVEQMYNIDMERSIHSIHNYIRDHTKISNEDKPFFIACILVALKKKDFKSIIEAYSQSKATAYIYDLIRQALGEYNIDVSVFEFLRNDDNNTHLLNIIEKVKSVYDSSPERDILNDFYSEFVKYSNTDSKSLGIVLTPPHIVKLMIELLDIQPNDVFLDLCTGTGSFVIEALKYKPEQVIACEYQNKLYTLMLCNMILRGAYSPETSNKFIKGDCFENEFKATKTAINPPYGTKGKRELDFIIKQLESLPEGGLATAIIPKSKLHNNSIQNKGKEAILKLAKIKTIINCSKDIFYPSANVDCCIILMERRGSIHPPYNINLIDYTNDGIVIAKHAGRVINADHKELYNNILLEARINTPEHNLELEADWCFLEKVKVGGDDELIIDFTEVYIDKLVEELEQKKRIILAQNNKKVLKGSKSFTIEELFTLKRGTSSIKQSKEDEKKEGTIYPLITASAKNNGITAYCKTWKYENCITVANNGSVASSFYHEYKFDASSDITVLIPKKPMEEIIMRFICIQLKEYKNMYSYSRKWTMTKMKTDTIKLPINEAGDIDEDKISALYGGA